MAKRLFDIVLSFCGLVLLSPLLVAVAVGIKLGTPGPMLYLARRVGLKGGEFVMHKFRTMRHCPENRGSAITASSDMRVSRFGALLRKLKIDELPQLWDVFVGDMSIVGPRPEDPEIVANYYTPSQRESLSVRPGLASPGSIFSYTHCHRFLSDDDPEGSYRRRLLPIKLALEIVYVRNRSFGYDLRIILRTCSVIILTLLGRKEFRDPPELSTAQALLRRGADTAPFCPAGGNWI